MTKGGYQIIDLQNKKLTKDVGMVFDGIYEKIKGTRKAILLSGLNVDGVEYRDIFVETIKLGPTYSLKCFAEADNINFSGVVTIEDNDVVIAVDK